MQTMEILSPLIRVLFPDFCIVCKKYGTIICNSCLLELPHNKRHINEYCIAGLSYRDPAVKKIILTLKSRNNPELIDSCSQILFDSLMDHISELTILHNFSKPLIIPVPASTKRLSEFGFNQAELLARSLQTFLTELEPEIHTNVFSKKKTLTKQAKARSRVERFQNISKAFMINPAIDVRNKCCIIVDDVITTGATMHALREQLLRAGARHVLCVAVAH